MAWEENSRICLHMQLIAILSRIGVTSVSSVDSVGERIAKEWRLRGYGRDAIPSYEQKKG